MEVVAAAVVRDLLEGILRLQDAVDQGWFREAPTQTSPPCLKTILATARQIALGFSHLHAKGIVHGDVSGGGCTFLPDRGSAARSFQIVETLCAMPLPLV